MLGNHVSSQKSNASKKHPKWQQSLNWQIQNKVKSKERKKIHKTRLPKITHTSPLIRARSWNWIIGSGFIHCRKDWNVLTFFAPFTIQKKRGGRWKQSPDWWFLAIVGRENREDQLQTRCPPRTLSSAVGSVSGGVIFTRSLSALGLSWSWCCCSREAEKIHCDGFIFAAEIF